MLPGVAHHVSQSQSLPGIHQLLHIAQIQFPVPCGEGGLPEPLDIQPLLTVSVSAVVLPGLAVAGQVNNPSARRQMEPWRRQHRCRPAFQRRFDLRRDIFGVVGIHLHHTVGNMEVGSAASHHQNQRYPRLLPQIQRPLQERDFTSIVDKNMNNFKIRYGLHINLKF